jgi:outer membrane protein W
MRTRLLLALALGILALPLFAQSNDIGVWYSSSKLGSTMSEGAEVKFSSGHGYAASFNHFWIGSFSTEFAYTDLRNDGNLRFEGQNVLDLGRLSTKVATGIAQWHMKRGGLVDPYVGAGLAYLKSGGLHTSDLDQAGIGAVPIEKKWGWAANAGVTLNIGHGLSVAVDGKYVPYKPSSGQGSNTLELKLNPTILSGGLRVRF